MIAVGILSSLLIAIYLASIALVVLWSIWLVAESRRQRKIILARLRAPEVTQCKGEPLCSGKCKDCRLEDAYDAFRLEHGMG